jgi:hypothetical protein
MRDRFIECMRPSCNHEGKVKRCVERMTDALIAAGAILPKFKIGQEVFFIHRFIIDGVGAAEVIPAKVYGFSFHDHNEDLSYAIEYIVFGECQRTVLSECNVFATESEALAALTKTKCTICGADNSQRDIVGGVCIPCSFKEIT